MRIEQPAANGLSTDHPVPGLPFVDDSHLPLQDGKGIERHGRHDHNPGWGRHDADRSELERWTAFTDDQFNLTWAWGVRTEPGYGRTVLLYHSADATIMHTVQPRPGDPLAFRAGRLLVGRGPVVSPAGDSRPLHGAGRGQPRLGRGHRVSR